MVAYWRSRTLQLITWEAAQAPADTAYFAAFRVVFDTARSFSTEIPARLPPSPSLSPPPSRDPAAAGPRTAFSFAAAAARRQSGSCKTKSASVFLAR